MAYYLAIKRNELLKQAMMFNLQNNYAEWKNTHRKYYTFYDSIYIIAQDMHMNV